MSTHPEDEAPLSDLRFWAGTAAEREDVFRELRAHRPITWHRPAEGTMLPPEDGDGYWAVVRHADIVQVSKAPELYSSAQGTQFENIPPELLELSQSFLAMDAPRHTLLRRLVSAAFTPRRVARLEQQIRAQAARIVDELLDAGPSGDFVDRVSRQLPMWTIFEMLGLPPERRDELAHAADASVGWADEDVRGDLEPAAYIFGAITSMTTIGMELAARRRVEPADDLMTNLVQADVDGRGLTDQEIGAFVVLLSVAGNDTTRNTISHTMRALTEHPDQRAYLAADLDTRIGPAVEEFIRYATPVMTFRRTVTADTTLSGVDIRAGEKVVLFYPSGNRDERVFADPDRFDLARNPNPHLGFGGGGVHFCLGNGLARTQLRAIFTELLTRAPDLRAGPPVPLVSNFIHGVKSMPYDLSYP